MNKFLYVFSEKERDKLLELGYNLIKSDTECDIFVFENQDKLSFSQKTIKAAPSDTLTF